MDADLNPVVAALTEISDTELLALINATKNSLQKERGKSSAASALFLN